MHREQKDLSVERAVVMVGLAFTIPFVYILAIGLVRIIVVSVVKML
jgi:hypothetical protein